MLYLAPRAAGWSVNAVRALTSLVKQLDGYGTGDVIHVHWTSPIVQNAESEIQARDQLRAFQAGVDGALARGASLIWTVHEATLPGCRYPELELELVQFLGDRAHEIHLLTPHAEAEIEQHLGSSAAKFRRPRHASFAGIYDDSSARSDARRRWEVEESETVVLIPVRGETAVDVDLFCDAVQRANLAAEPIVLLVAAEQAGVKTGNLIPADSKNVRVIHSQMPPADESSQDWFAAADVMTFLNASSPRVEDVLRAATFGVPSIVPGSEYLRRQFGAEQWVQFFDAQEAFRALSSLVVGFTRDDLLNKAAKAFAYEYTLHDMSRDFLARLNLAIA